MLHNGNISPVQVTITLSRMFGGFWAYRQFVLVHDDETLNCVTGGEGKVILQIIPSDQEWRVVVDDKTLGTFKSKPTDFTTSFTL